MFKKCSLNVFSALAKTKLKENKKSETHLADQKSKYKFAFKLLLLTFFLYEI